MNFEFIKNMDYKKFLSEEQLMEIDTIGLDAFIKLYEMYGKTTKHFSVKNFDKMRVEYIRKMKGKKTVRELVRETGYSDSYIYKIWKDTENNNKNNLDLFEEE